MAVIDHKLTESLECTGCKAHEEIPKRERKDHDSRYDYVRNWKLKHSHHLDAKEKAQ